MLNKVFFLTKQSSSWEVVFNILTIFGNIFYLLSLKLVHVPKVPFAIEKLFSFLYKVHSRPNADTEQSPIMK